MTNSDITALSDQELIEALAIEVMGWEDGGGHWWCPRCEDWIHGAQVSFAQVHQREGCGETVRSWKEAEDGWNPLNDWNQTMEVESAVKLIHIRDDIYVEKLWEIVYDSHIARLQFGPEAIMVNRGFRLIHATQRQRCLAALQTVRPLS